MVQHAEAVELPYDEVIHPFNEIRWTLDAEVKSCQNVIGINPDGTSNVWLQLQLVSSRNLATIFESKHTEVVSNTNNPKYIHDAFTFGDIFDIRKNIRTTSLQIKVFHKFPSSEQEDICLGVVMIPLSSLPWTEKTLGNWYSLEAPTNVDRVTGKVRMRLLLQGPPTTGSFSGKGDTVQVLENEETREVQVLDQTGEKEDDDADETFSETDFIEEARMWLSEASFYKFYVFSATSLAALEAVVVSYSPEGWWLILQQVILALSTALFISVIVASYSFIPGKSKTGLSRFQKLQRIMTIETVFEFGTLIFGWALLFTYPGIAVLRCLRLLRFLWFFEFIYAHDRDTFLVWILRNFEIALDFLEKVYEDMLTRRTPGGTVVLALFFYTCYVFGASIWIYTKGTTILASAIAAALMS